MGQNKAELLWNGRSLLERVFRQVSELLPVGAVWVSGSYSAYPSIPDLVPDLGPLGGMDSALKYFKNSASHLLVVPVDMPRLDSSWLKRLLAEASVSSQDIVRYQKRELPFVLKVQLKLNGILEKCLEGQGTGQGAARSIKNFISHLDVKELSLKKEEEIYFMNINTPEEWQACREFASP